jgi:hypothetical protein
MLIRYLFGRIHRLLGQGLTSDATTEKTFPASPARDDSIVAFVCAASSRPSSDVPAWMTTGLEIGDAAEVTAEPKHPYTKSLVTAAVSSAQRLQQWSAAKTRFGGAGISSPAW